MFYSYFTQGNNIISPILELAIGFILVFFYHRWLQFCARFPAKSNWVNKNAISSTMNILIFVCELLKT